MALTQLIHLTALYSNAVLTAVLPHVNDFAKKAELPIPLPITTNQVEKMLVLSTQGSLGGTVFLTNDYKFFFSNGYLSSFYQIKDNPFVDDDLYADLPHYFGKETINTNQAIEMARANLQKLGYKLKEIHADLPPTSVEGGREVQGGFFPYCRIKWHREATNEEEFQDSVFIEFQINLKDKSIMGMSVFGRKLMKPDPHIDVVPETEADYRQRMKSASTNAPLPSIQNAQTNAVSP